MAQLFHRELEVLGDLVHGGGKGVVVHVSDDVVDPAVLKQVFAAPTQIVLVVAVLIPLSLVRLYHELALRWVRVGHRQRIRDLPGKQSSAASCRHRNHPPRSCCHLIHCRQSRLPQQ